MTLRKTGRRRDWVLPVLLAGLIAASILTSLDKWLYSNEVFNSLAMGLHYETDDEALVRLRSEALRYCELYAPRSELKSCQVYQNVITDRVYFAHPMTALIGLQARALLNDPGWQAKLQRIAIAPPLLGGAIALAIWLLLTLAMPKEDRAAAVTIVFFVMTTSQSFDRGPSPIPDLARDAGSWLSLLSMLGAAAAAYWAAAKSAAVERVRAWIGHRLGSAPVNRIFWLAIALYLLSLALPAALNVVLAPLALLVLLFALLPLAARSAALSPVILAAMLGLLFAAVTSESYWFMQRLGSAKDLATLIFVALIGLVTLRPQTRLVWTLPAMAIFHLPLAALLGLATILTETALSLRRRQPSQLLYAAAATFAIAMTGIVFGFESDAFAPGGAPLSDALRLILAWSGLVPALLSLALAGIFALAPLSRLDDAHLGLARGGLLIFQGLVAALASAAIQNQDPSLLNAPGFAMIAKPASYMTPALFAAGIFAILLMLRHLLAKPDNVPATGSHGREALLVVTALFLLITVSKIDLKLRNTYGPAPINLWRYVIAGELHPQWCRHLLHARLDDETYYLSKEDPTNAAVIYWSAMKARLRTDAGVFRPEAFTVLPSVDEPKGCAGNASASPATDAQ